MATQRIFTAEETQKKFEALPPEVKELLYSAEMNLAIQKVGERNKLHYDQMGRLEMETTNVLLGFTETADYPGILMMALSVDEAAANAIAKDINDTLFIKIREAMKTNVHANTASIPAMKNPPAMSAASTAEKSVVMPSAARPPINEMPHVTPAAPAAAPVRSEIPASPATTATPSVPAVVKPAGLPSIPHLDAMLSQPTVSIAPKPQVTPPAVTASAPSTTPTSTPDITNADAPKPGPSYSKADPYHEPVD